MELLLILSAMLSAITGAFVGARAPEARPQSVAIVQAEAPCVEEAQRSVRLPVAASDLGERIAAVFAAPALDVPAGIPLYADRLIE